MCGGLYGNLLVIFFPHSQQGNVCYYILLLLPLEENISKIYDSLHCEFKSSYLIYFKNNSLFFNVTQEINVSVYFNESIICPTKLTGIYLIYVCKRTKYTFIHSPVHLRKGL